MASEDAPEEKKKNKMVNLISSDGEQFKVNVDLAKQSPIIAQRIQKHDGDDPPTVSVKVPSDILPEIIKHWEKHAGEEDELESVREENELWDAEFVKKMGNTVIFGVIEAAYNLEMTKLLDLTCQKVADMIKGKSVEEMRRILNIKNDYTKEEEDELRREYAWALLVQFLQP